MNGNNFFFGTDPLLGSNTNFDAQLNELDKFRQIVEQRKAAALQMKEQMSAQPEQPQTKTPIWDEINAILGAMTDKEFEIATNNDEFIESQNAIMAILQAKQMEIMRPIVEGCKEGNEALNAHLTLVKRLKKAASNEVDKELNDFQEYREKYSDIPYAEYLKMKRNKEAK